MSERWRPVRGYEGAYEVSDQGNVRSLDRTDHYGRRRAGRALKPGTSDGYPAVHLRWQGRTRNVRIYRLVAEAWVPGEAPGLEVCHEDGDRLNSAASNLRWDTRQANQADILLHGHNYNLGKTHCPRNHEYTPENTGRQRLRSGRQGRVCLTCKRERRLRA